MIRTAEGFEYSKQETLKIRKLISER